jgi:hypothetical protein
MEFDVPMKPARFIIISLNKTYGKVSRGKCLVSGKLPIQNSVKQREDLSSLPFNISLKYATRNVQENQVGLKLNKSHQLLVSTANENLLGSIIATMQKTQRQKSMLVLRLVEK